MNRSVAGMSKRDAIEHGAGVRLRPILMTTAAMVLGVIPLVIASGAGAAGRFSMGLVIADRPFDRHLVHAVVVPACLYAARGGTTMPNRRNAPTTPAWVTSSSRHSCSDRALCRATRS